MCIPYGTRDAITISVRCPLYYLIHPCVASMLQISPEPATWVAKTSNVDCYFMPSLSSSPPPIPYLILPPFHQPPSIFATFPSLHHFLTSVLILLPLHPSFTTSSSSVLPSSSSFLHTSSFRNPSFPLFASSSSIIPSASSFKCLFLELRSPLLIALRFLCQIGS